jgi:hypothetical protein
MYVIDPIGDFKRTVLETIHKWKGVPGEMADNLIAEAHRSQNLKWRTQKEVDATTYTEQWTAMIQLYGLRRLLRRGELQLFLKRLHDYGWATPVDLVLLVGRRNGVLLPNTYHSSQPWWQWYERIHQNAVKKGGVAGWNEVFRYIEREVFNPFKK